MFLLVMLIHLAFTAYYWLMLARVVLSWAPREYQYHPVVQWIERMTEPVLYPIRRTLRRYVNTGPFDLSAVVAMIGIWLVRDLVIMILAALGIR